MAPLAENATARIRIQYRAFGLEHWAMLRYGRGSSQSVMEAGAFLTLGNIFSGFALNSQLAADFTWLQTLYVGEDQDSWNVSPNLPDPITGDVALASTSLMQRATHTKFSARGGGRSANLTLFGILWTHDSPSGDAQDGIVLASESAEIAAAIAALNSDVNVTIANEGAVWKNRANIKINDYWRDQLKG